MRNCMTAFWRSDLQYHTFFDFKRRISVVIRGGGKFFKRNSTDQFTTAVAIWNIDNSFNGRSTITFTQGSKIVVKIESEHRGFSTNTTAKRLLFSCGGGGGYKSHQRITSKLENVTFECRRGGGGMRRRNKRKWKLNVKITQKISTTLDISYLPIVSVDD